jgi:hypothetical protein
MSKTIAKLCSEHELNDEIDELILLLRGICVNTRRPRRMRRDARRKLEELVFNESDDSINYHLNSETDSDCSDSSVSSASSGSSENSFYQERTRERMGLNKHSSMEEWIRFEHYQRKIKNNKKAAKTRAKRESRRDEIVAKKASRKASEAKELRDAIKTASRKPVNNLYFLLQHAGFQYVWIPDEKKYAFVWINKYYHHEIVLFKGISSPRKKVICEEIGQRAWQYLRSGKLERVYDEISNFLKEKRNTGEAESETSTFEQFLFDPDADNADDEAE